PPPADKRVILSFTRVPSRTWRSARTAGCSRRRAWTAKSASGEPPRNNFEAPPVPHRAPVVAVRFGQDGKSLLTQSTDRVVRRWTVADSAPVVLYCTRGGAM